MKFLMFKLSVVCLLLASVKAVPDPFRSLPAAWYYNSKDFEGTLEVLVDKCHKCLSAPADVRTDTCMECVTKNAASVPKKYKITAQRVRSYTKACRESIGNMIFFVRRAQKDKELMAKHAGLTVHRYIVNRVHHEIMYYFRYIC